MKLSNNPKDKSNFLLVGKIVGVHGLKGNLKVHTYSDSIDIFEKDSCIFVQKQGLSKKSYKISQAKPYKKGILLTLEGVDDRFSSEAITGAELFIDKCILPELEENTYYWHDLIGLKVFNAENEYVGSIKSVIETGSNDVYVVKNDDTGKETLIPALKSVIRLIDFHDKTMEVDLPEGL